MIQNSNNIYRDATIRLDGNNFEGCTFDRCHLVFSGTGEIGISGCKFNACKWTFEGAAATTLKFLSSLYTGFGPDGEKLVEDTFNNIRAGQV